MSFDPVRDRFAQRKFSLCLLCISFSVYKKIPQCTTTQCTHALKVICARLLLLLLLTVLFNWVKLKVLCLDLSFFHHSYFPRCTTCLMWPKSLNEVLIEKWQIVQILRSLFHNIWTTNNVTTEIKLYLFSTEAHIQTLHPFSYYRRVPLIPEFQNTTGFPLINE